MPSTAELVKACTLFAGLEEATLAELADEARVERHAKRAQLFREGDPASSLYLMRAGRLKLTKVGANGQEIVVRFLLPGEPFGAIAIVAAAEYPVSAEVVETAETLSWGAEFLRRISHRQPALALNTTRVISGRMRELQERYRELATERVSQRVARAVLRLVRQAGRRVEGGVLLDLPLSQQDLAELTGTTLFTISRTLSAWEVQGLVETARERLLIRSPHGLVKIAEDLID